MFRLTLFLLLLSSFAFANSQIRDLSLNGVKMEGPRTLRSPVALLNNTLFHETQGRGAFGFEKNLQLHPQRSAAMFAPQYHQKLPGQIHVQPGLGASAHARTTWKPVVALRVIRELN